MDNLLFPMFITWSITSTCNLRCKHCFRSEYDIEYLNEKKIQEIITLFKNEGVQGIILTGGEPLTSKYLFNILKEIDGKIKVGIATNGTLFTEDLLKKILSFNVKSFQISLDGTSSEINDYIRGKGTFEKIIKNIELLQKYNCDITIAMTVNSYNYVDIKENALTFAAHYGNYNVIVMEIK